MDWDIPFFRHDLGAAELDAVREVLAGPVLTTGEYVERLEVELAALLGRRHVVALNSCTGALHLSLLASGIGPGSEVITTPLTFIATTLAIVHAGARPVFVDVEPDTGNLDASRIERAITARTRAIMPVHLYGQMCDMSAIHDVAQRHGLTVIEDSAHCIEGQRAGKHPGDGSAAACFSFYASKNLTCGEGGAVATDDDGLARQLRLLRLHGMTPSSAERYRDGFQHWDVLVPGWKYNMDNIHAALLLAQLPRIEPGLEARERIARKYAAAIDAIPGVQCMVTRPGVVHARHLFPVRVAASARDRIVQALQDDGIGVGVNYRPVTTLTWVREHYGIADADLPEANRIGNEIFSLPIYPRLTERDTDWVIDSLGHALDLRRTA